jgi:hypothetical protein
MEYIVVFVFVGVFWVLRKKIFFWVLFIHAVAGGQGRVLSVGIFGV